MINYNDLFYSFQLDEIKGFEEIKRTALELSVIPNDFDLTMLHANIGIERHQYLRNSLEELPDKEKELKCEAKMHLNKVLPILNSNIKDSNHRESKEWSFRPGHIAFNPQFHRLKNLNQLLNDFFKFNCIDAGDFYYPPNGFRSWHTNKYDLESWFAFFVDVDQPKKSFFKFIDPETNELITHWDEPKTINIFKIKKLDLFWHCIGTTEGNRWSQGFTIPGNWKEKLL
jgi:hypothetical protein